MPRGPGAIELGQLPLWLPKSDWRPPRMVDLPSWKGAKRVGIDIEAFDPDLQEMGIGVRRSGTWLAGISFAIEDGPEFYLPLNHKGGDNVEDPGAALRYVQDQAREFEGDVVGMNLGFDLDWLLESKVEFKKARFFRDISVADPLLWELHFQYGMNAIAKRWDLPGKDEELITEAARAYGLHPKAAIGLLPARFVGPYAGTDARRPLQILRRQERELDRQNLTEIWDLESHLLPVLVRLRRRGVAVSSQRLEEVRDWSFKEEAEQYNLVRSATGVSLTHEDAWSAEAFANALRAADIELQLTADGNPSITKELLEDISTTASENSKEKITADALSRARKMSKLRQFADSVDKHTVNGRIHCTFNQLRNSGDDDFGDTKSKERGVKFGRVSCESPNLQQQPSRDDFADRWRSIYIPEDGCEWTCADYSQQEPRMMVYYAERMAIAAEKKGRWNAFPGAREAAQAYRDNPKVDNHDMMTRLVYGDELVDSWDKTTFKGKRSQCKDIFLGKCYGQGGASICEKLHLPTRWAVFFRRTSDTGWRPPAYFEDKAEAIAHARQEGGRVNLVAGAEGQAILDTFDAKLPFVGKLAKACEKKAARVGVIRTLMGRACHFAAKPDGTFDWAYKALNRLIQGSCADQMKKALVEADAAGLYIQLQVHDELDGSLQSREESKQLAQIMRDTVQLPVPFHVDLEIGPSWGEIEKVAA